MVKIVNRYDYQQRPVPRIKCDVNSKKGRSLTVQSAREECDINAIMARYEKTGLMKDPNTGAPTRIPQFGDFSDIGDYHAVMTRLADLQDQFMKLPAKIRARFDNDPGKLVAFVEDDRNYAEAVKLGIVEERQYVQPPELAAGKAGSVQGAPTAPNEAAKAAPGAPAK